MKYEYDPSCDCGYIYISNDPALLVARTIQVKVIADDSLFGSVHLDINTAGHIVGIEVLGVTSIMPELIGLARDYAAMVTGEPI